MSYVQCGETIVATFLFAGFNSNASTLSQVGNDKSLGGSQQLDGFG